MHRERRFFQRLSCTLDRSALYHPLPRRNRCYHPISGSADRSLEETRWRSEEHTSELQSLTNIVCRLLLEKKKQTIRLVASSSAIPSLIFSLQKPLVATVPCLTACLIIV